ncbi:hypothetical protein [Flavobacterium sp. LS1R10]|uniref:hypothetical protein n=1 Tax=Flavobacterium sp. LS1R10 TaxID=2497482 RepID=UPI000F828F52|nr:hypothetical protein [Flavobacterium sp. LS1R10]RTY74180.1 hypothetical protein EKL96_08930 [Flavobacterium sp. LS1R10]
MKKLLLVAIITISLHSVVSFGQKSEYNSNVKLETLENSVFGEWFVNKVGSKITESIMYKQTPVGVMNCSYEIEKVLSFYNLKLKDKTYKEMILPEGIDFKNYTLLSSAFKSEEAFIRFEWKTSKGKKIVWACIKDSNFIMIER